MISATLIGFAKLRSVVLISKETTVRDVATSKYHLFRRITRVNSLAVAPFTTVLRDGDTVTVDGSVV